MGEPLFFSCVLTASIADGENLQLLAFVLDSENKFKNLFVFSYWHDSSDLHHITCMCNVLEIIVHVFIVYSLHDKLFDPHARMMILIIFHIDITGL